MLAGKGYSKIYNLTGGIKAWGKEVAVGPEDSGMYLFTDVGSAEEAIITGFGLEMGLRDFYLSMQKKIASEPAKVLFGKLADVEIIHEKRLVELHNDLTGEQVSLSDFTKRIVEPAMEGGLTTEEYLRLFSADLDSELEVIGLALSIEAQALDLYLRAAAKSESEAVKSVLKKIADEERSHIEHLSRYIDDRQDLS